ncbi:Aste57867_16847 [Aphanomyces stellatus]|uniref:Aste57867_16847 protein n=1 Tax=Aphanomyces stellatus TaxID=120398 RepID=A0A485L8A2_9STRA|nr:hypothetical protein As57867_016789 [Aphanomyces stellatus]VFT93611.1 Aste57867_16847 [Aphanomyces stellatus]
MTSIPQCSCITSPVPWPCDGNVPSSPVQVDCDSLLAKTTVQFTTATTYLFGVAHGGSAVPKKTGPAVGMTRTHCDVFTHDIADSSTKHRRRVRKFNHLERVAMLKAAAYTGHDIAAFCMEAINIRQSRQATADEVRALKKRAALDETADGAKNDDPSETHKKCRRM